MSAISLEYLNGLHLANSNSRAKAKTAEKSMRVPPIFVVTDQDQFLGYPTQSHFWVIELDLMVLKVGKQLNRDNQKLGKLSTVSLSNLHNVLEFFYLKTTRSPNL